MKNIFWNSLAALAFAIVIVTCCRGIYHDLTYVPPPAPERVAPPRTYPAISAESFPMVDLDDRSGSSVVISCTEVDGVYRLGVLTAAHVVTSKKILDRKSYEVGNLIFVDDPQELFVECPTYRLQAQALVIDERIDLALFVVISPSPVKTTTLMGQDDEPEIGAPMWFISWPRGRFMVSFGCYGTPEMVSTPGYPGGSGGPIIGLDGRLMGVGTRIVIVKNAQNVKLFVTHMLLFVNGPRVENFLKRCALARTFRSDSHPSTTSQPETRK